MTNPNGPEVRAMSMEPFQAPGHAPEPRVLSPIEPNPTILGDFAHMPHEASIAVVNRVYREANLHHNEANEVKAAAQAKVLEAGVDAFKDHVADPRNYPEVNGQGALEHVRLGYTRADLRADMELADFDRRIALRLGQFDGVRIVSDIDGTATLLPKEGADAYLEKLIPHSVDAEEELRQVGRGEFPRVFAKYWQEAMQDPIRYELMRRGGMNPFIEIRPGYEDMVRVAKEHGIDITFLSANFEPFAEGILSKMGSAVEGSGLYAVRAGSIISSEKGDMLEHIAKGDPRRAVIYLGDGGSDIPAVDAGDFIAVYGAVKGGSFEKELQAHHRPHFTFETGDDITKKLRDFGAIPPVSRVN